RHSGGGGRHRHARGRRRHGRGAGVVRRRRDTRAWRFVMPFPTRLLGEDETVVLDLHPHWKLLILPSLLVPVVVGVASYLIFLVPSGSVRTPLRWAIVVAALLVLLRWAVWRFLVWTTTRY